MVARQGLFQVNILLLIGLGHIALVLWIHAIQPRPPCAAIPASYHIDIILMTYADKLQSDCGKEVGDRRQYRGGKGESAGNEGVQIPRSDHK